MNRVQFRIVRMLYVLILPYAFFFLHIVTVLSNLLLVFILSLAFLPRALRAALLEILMGCLYHTKYLKKKKKEERAREKKTSIHKPKDSMAKTTKMFKVFIDFSLPPSQMSDKFATVFSIHTYIHIYSCHRSYWHSYESATLSLDATLCKHNNSLKFVPSVFMHAICYCIYWLFSDSLRQTNADFSPLIRLLLKCIR